MVNILSKLNATVGFGIGTVATGSNINGDKNDFAPSTDFTAGRVGFMSVLGTGAYNLSGIDSSGYEDGDEVSIVLGSSLPVFLLNASTLSSAANRLNLPGVSVGCRVPWFPGQTLRLHKFTSWQVIGLGPATDHESWPQFFDDFFFNSTESGEVGELGWTFTNGSCNAQSVADVNGHGIMRRTSSATTNQVNSMTLTPTTTTAAMQFQRFLEYAARLALVATNADFDIRFGICDDPSTVTPVHGVYFERLAADTSWFGVARNASTQTRTAALLAQDTSFHKFSCLRLLAGTARFIVDEGTPVDISTANVPDATDLMTPFFQIRPTSTNARSADLDYISLQNNKTSGRV